MTVVIIGENSPKKIDFPKEKKVTIATDVHKDIQQCKSPLELNENPKPVVPNLSSNPFEVSLTMINSSL